RGRSTEPQATAWAPHVTQGSARAPPLLLSGWLSAPEALTKLTEVAPRRLLSVLSVPLPRTLFSTRGSLGTQVSHGEVNSPIAVVPFRERWVPPEHAFSTATGLPFLMPHPPIRDEVGHPLLHRFSRMQPRPLPSVDAANRVAIPHGPGTHP